MNPARPQDLLLEYLGRIESIVAAFRPGSSPLTVLHIGGGGFAYPGYLAAARPGTESTVLELDPEVVEIAREELGLNTGPDLRVRTGDARMSILDEPSGAYDLVVGDAFSSRSVPWHLTTSEFLAEVRRVLRPDGVYALNLIDGGELGFLRAELATLGAVFEDVVVIANPGQTSGNFVVAASPAPLPLEALRRHAAASGAEVIDAATLTEGAPILTDDFAPVDQLIGSTPGERPLGTFPAVSPHVVEGANDEDQQGLQDRDQWEQGSRPARHGRDRWPAARERASPSRGGRMLRGTRRQQGLGMGVIDGRRTRVDHYAPTKGLRHGENPVLTSRGRGTPRRRGPSAVRMIALPWIGYSDQVAVASANSRRARVRAGTKRRGVR